MSLTVQLACTAAAFMAVAGGIVWWVVNRFDREFGSPPTSAPKAKAGG